MKAEDPYWVDVVAQAIAECDVFTYHNSPDYSHDRPFSKQANADEWRKIARTAVAAYEEVRDHPGARRDPELEEK